jgi:photosystem II stability/assembly factor-like uncharacterized protein
MTRLCRRLQRCGPILAAALCLLALLTPAAAAATGAEQGHWSTQAALPESAANAVCATDSEHVWVVATEHATSFVLVTTDGGASWTRHDIPTKAALLAVVFIDQRHGWAVGKGNVIMATGDGGRHWQKQYATVKRENTFYLNVWSQDQLASVSFVSPTTGWAVGGRGLVRGETQHSSLALKTTDGGATWRRQPSPSGDRPLHTVFFIDARHGWMGGEHGLLVRTTDGGRHWRREDSGTTLAIDRILFTSRRRGWAVAEKEVSRGYWKYGLLRTSDGGRHWSEVQLPEDVAPWAIAADAGGFVCVVGGRFRQRATTAVALSRDGGASWTVEEVSANGLWDVALAGSRVWALGGGSNDRQSLIVERSPQQPTSVHRSLWVAGLAAAAIALAVALAVVRRRRLATVTS